MRTIYTTKEMIRRKQILERLRQASVQQDVLPNTIEEAEDDSEEDVQQEAAEEKIKLETIPSMAPEEEDLIDTIDAVSDYSTERAVRADLNKLRELRKQQGVEQTGKVRKAFKQMEEQREKDLLRQLTSTQPGPYEYDDIDELTKRQQQVETAVTRNATLPKLGGTPEVHQFRSEEEKEKFLKTTDSVIATLPEDDGLTDEERAEFSTAVIQMNPALARLNIVLKTRNYPEKKHQQLMLAFVQTYDAQQPRATELRIPKTQNPEFGVRDITFSEEEFFLPSELVLRSQIIATGGTVSDVEPPALCTFCVEGNYYFDALNVPLLTRFMTKSGRIIPRKYTGLCGSHQRKISKTIRIARNIGIFSYKKGDFQIHTPFASM